MATDVRETEGMIKVPLREVKDRLSHFVDEASKQQVVITRHGKPVAVLIGFADEDEWFEYRLTHDPRFRDRIAQSREQARTVQFTRLEDLSD